ncbi:MAG: MFS transporter, partial [Candidatus Tectomicrobia bacterium]|nr:MFS transporter [Candidatus Tectomicrobia bacterium]
MTRLFYGIAANTLVASLLNTWVWFAITLWVYLETSSVIATSVLAGLFTVTAALAGCYLGALVDRYPKKRLMLASSLASG